MARVVYCVYRRERARHVATRLHTVCASYTCRLRRVGVSGQLHPSLRGGFDADADAHHADDSLRQLNNSLCSNSPRHRPVPLRRMHVDADDADDSALLAKLPPLSLDFSDGEQLL
ncbi:unnamed protein product [Agarophyton chilense]